MQLECGPIVLHTSVASFLPMGMFGGKRRNSGAPHGTTPMGKHGHGINMIGSSGSFQVVVVERPCHGCSLHNLAVAHLTQEPHDRGKTRPDNYPSVISQKDIKRVRSQKQE